MASIINPGVGKDTRWKKGGPSPNPGGRPRSRTLSEMLRAKLVEIDINDPQHRTHAERIADNLIWIASSEDRGAIAAAAEIADRVEGKVHQSVAVANLTAEVHSKSDDDLRFYLDHGCWPDREDETASTSGSASA